MISSNESQFFENVGSKKGVYQIWGNSNLSGNKFFRKRHFILNYFICNITTAISEGINNKIKRLSRMAYGFKDVYYFLLKIHQHCGMLNPRFST